MSKYRGKYTNSRTCKHADMYYMALVSVKETCPSRIKSRPHGDFYTSKEVCQQCEHYEPGGKPKSWYDQT